MHASSWASGVDQPLLWYQGKRTDVASQRGLFANWQGSIVAVTSYGGTPIAINSYDEYGIPAATNVGRFQYSLPEPCRGHGEANTTLATRTGPLLLQSTDWIKDKASKEMA